MADLLSLRPSLKLYLRARSDQRWQRAVWKYKPDPLCLNFYICISNNQHIYRLRGEAWAGSWGLQCLVCKLYWGKGWGLCKQVFMSRSDEGLPISVCPREFLAFSHLPVSWNRFLDIQYLEPRLQAPAFCCWPNLQIWFSWQTGLELVWFWFSSSPHRSYWHMALVLPLPSHLSSVKTSCLSSILRAMIRRWFESRRVNDSQFPALIAVRFFTQTLRSRILFLAAIPVFCLSIKQTPSRSL